MKRIACLSELSVSQLARYEKLHLSQSDKDDTGAPLRIPELPLDRQVVVRVDYGDTHSESEIFSCDSIEEMRALHLSHSEFRSPASLAWYICDKE